VNDEYVTMVIRMSDGSEHLVGIPSKEVDGFLIDVTNAMNNQGQLMLPKAKMLFNGVHIVAVVPKFPMGESS
jgi:hypothetical protein